MVIALWDSEHVVFVSRLHTKHNGLKEMSLVSLTIDPSSYTHSLSFYSVESTCDQEVYNNITYFVSPKFPALMPSDKEHCKLKIKLVSDDISQIRLDFLHFTLVSQGL